MVIPHLLINNKFISDFEVKANYFSNLFASQYISFNNNSKITETQSYITNTKLSSVKFESKDISHSISSLVFK